MRDFTIPESGAKRKLLDAAELLFAEKGFEAVSVRDITQLAKTNIAAVNYHFGSRDHLLTLVMMRYMTPVTEERLVRLDFVEGNDLVVEVRVVHLQGEERRGEQARHADLDALERI